MKAIFLLAATIGVLKGSPAYGFTTLAVKSASCVVSTGMHMAVAFIIPFLLIFALYRTIQIEKDMERTHVENFLLLLFKVILFALTIRLAAEIVQFFGVPVKLIAQDMLYCKGECDFFDAPVVPACDGLPFSGVLKFLLVASAFFSKSLAVLVPALAFMSLFYKSATQAHQQVQRGMASVEMASFGVIRDVVFYFFFILPYITLSSFSLGVEYAKIVEWFAKVILEV